MSEIARDLGIPKSSAHRLLGTLLRRGLVERDGRRGYQAGMGLVALGLGVLDREPVVVAARPVLETLAEDLGETCFLVAARAGELSVLEKAEGKGFLRAAPQVGSRVPAHATAAGKLHLAFAADRVSAPPRFERYTERTLAGPAALEAELAGVREAGMAWNRDEWIPGLSVVAAPIHSSTRMVAAVALALPTSRLASLGEAVLVAGLRAAAGQISARLSGGELPQGEPPQEARHA